MVIPLKRRKTRDLTAWWDVTFRCELTPLLVPRFCRAFTRSVREDYVYVCSQSLRPGGIRLDFIKTGSSSLQRIFHFFAQMPSIHPILQQVPPVSFYRLILQGREKAKVLFHTVRPSAAWNFRSDTSDTKEAEQKTASTSSLSRPAYIVTRIWASLWAARPAPRAPPLTWVA